MFAKYTVERKCTIEQARAQYKADVAKYGSPRIHTTSVSKSWCGVMHTFSPTVEWMITPDWIIRYHLNVDTMNSVSAKR